MAERKVVAIILTPEDMERLGSGLIVYASDAFGNVTPILPPEHPARDQYISLAEYRPAATYMG